MMTVSIANRPVVVASFTDASARVRKYIAAKGMGMHGYARGNHGAIKFGGEQVARVSFNGRVWCSKCKGEIDAQGTARFQADHCQCGNTSHANALTP